MREYCNAGRDLAGLVGGEERVEEGETRHHRCICSQRLDWRKPLGKSDLTFSFSCSRFGIWRVNSTRVGSSYTVEFPSPIFTNNEKIPKEGVKVQEKMNNNSCTLQQFTVLFSSQLPINSYTNQ